MTIAAPADRRFRRARVRPVRKRRWIARIFGWIRTALVLAACVYAGARVVQYMDKHRVLAVRHIQVSETRRVSQGEVMAVLDGLHGQNILVVNLETWRRRLVGSPWIRDARLRRVLPGTIEVDVVERQPMGIARVGGQLFLVDDTGVIIEEYGPAHAEFDLPIIDGLRSDPTAGGPLIEASRAGLANRLLRAVEAKPELARRISQIDVHNPRNAVVILDQDPALLRLGHERFLERLQSYLELAPVLRRTVAEVDYVDLRFDDRVYVGVGRTGQVQTVAPPGK